MTVFNDLFDQTSAALDSAEFLADHINGNQELSDQGKDAQWQKQSTVHRDYAAYLTDQINQVRAAADTEVATAYDEAMPAATTDQGRIAAELGAQRVLSRGTLTNLGTVDKWFTTEPASPARTLVVNELVARDVIEPDHVEVLVRHGSPVYDMAIKNRSQADTILTHIIQAKVNRLTDKLADRTKQPYNDGLDIAAVQGRVDSILTIIGAPASIKPFSASMYERGLRRV